MLIVLTNFELFTIIYSIFNFKGKNMQDYTSKYYFDRYKEYLKEGNIEDDSLLKILLDLTADCFDDIKKSSLDISKPEKELMVKLLNKWNHIWMKFTKKIITTRFVEERKKIEKEQPGKTIDFKKFNLYYTPKIEPLFKITVYKEIPGIRKYWK